MSYRVFILAFLFILACGSNAICQDGNSSQAPPPAPSSSDAKFSDNLEFGGNLGVGIGTTTLINLSPIAGYRISRRWAAGLGVTYLYFRDGISQYSTSVYGGRLYTRYTVIQNIFGYGEYEVLNGEFDPFELGKRVNVTSLLAGAGIQQSLGGAAFLNFMVLWNFNDSRLSPYQNPIFRGGVVFGLR